MIISIELTASLRYDYTKHYKGVVRMRKTYNFSAGPAMLPEEVLQQASQELLDYRGSGQSVMEMSHRSSVYNDIFQETKTSLKKLVNIPDNYEIIFTPGGASALFGMIAQNLMPKKSADYIITGNFSKKAAQEARKFGYINIVASSEDKNFTYIPDVSKIQFNETADYVHICENNTIFGTKFKQLPNTNGIPLIADMSSCYLSEPIDVTQYGMIYGGVQKNIGPAGVGLSIINKDIIPIEISDNIPTMNRFDTYIDNDSMYNTPPTYTIYMCGLVFKWLLNQGGLSAIQQKNIKKAQLLYDYIDQSALFSNPVNKNDRSLMNVPFVTGDPQLDKKFIKEASDHHLVNLAGHRLVGGMRASIYNAMPFAGVQALVDFMEKFERENR